MITDEQILFLSLFSKILSGISLAALLFILFCVLRWANIKSFATELIFVLIIQEIFVSVGYILPTDVENQKVNALCYVQSFLISFFANASQFWVCCISFTAWHSFNSTEIVEESKLKCRVIFISISFGIPAILVTV